MTSDSAGYVAVKNPDQLTICRICGHEVARTAPTCPNCGAVLRRSPITLAMLALVALVLIALVLALYYGTPQNLGIGWLQFFADIAWPLAVLAVIGLLTLTPTGRRLSSAIASRVRNVKALGVDIELSPETASNVKATFEDVLTSYREQVKQEFDHQVRAFNIDAMLHRLVNKKLWGALPADVKKDFRCTIHVEDVLVGDQLYQLLDYFPSGGGAGRPFSMRSRLIGKAWRLEKSKREGQVPTDRVDLIEQYGMTLSEATVAGQGRHSFAAILISNSAKIPVGLFYCDSAVPDAFDTQFEDLVVAGVDEVGLSAALDALGGKMRSLGPNIPSVV